MPDRPQDAPPRFFVEGLLAEALDVRESKPGTAPRRLPGPNPRFAAGEAEHARKALRLRAGDRVEGLDGQGGRWPLRITRLGRREAELELDGEPSFDPRPGEPGAPLPWIELAVAWPRQSRGAEMLGRLVQLGVAAVRPLDARQQGPQRPPWGDAPADGEPPQPSPQSEGAAEAQGAAQTPRPPERWLRLAREACKQSGRSWLPELLAPCSPQALVDELESRGRDGMSLEPSPAPSEQHDEQAARGSSATAAERLDTEDLGFGNAPAAHLAVLDPHRGMAFDTWARSLLPLPDGRGTREAPIVLVVGPEGGFAASETDALLLAGATAVRLTPHVLRIETAAEAAAAVCGTILSRV